MHTAWSILFHCPECFWSLLSKEHLALLSSTCQSFRADIPQRVAIMALFKDKPIKKVNLFRLLPLSVHDVLGMRSPVDFLAAFAIAERKAGDFHNCLGIMREKGWFCWITEGEKRAKRRQGFEDELKRLGVVDLPVSDPIYRAALVLQNRAMDSVAVWQYETTDKELLPCDIYNPYAAPLDLDRRLAYSRTKFLSNEYPAILQMLRLAMSYYYRGVNADVRQAMQTIRAARTNNQERCTVVLLSHQCLMIGLVEIRKWVGPQEG